MLKKFRSQAGSSFKSLGLATSCQGGCDGVVAILSLSEGRIRKAVARAREVRGGEEAPFLGLQKLAGRPSCAQTAVVGRLGRAALEPIYELCAKGWGAFPKTTKRCLERRKDIPPQP